MIDIYKTLQQYNVKITVYDPWADINIVKDEYDITITNLIPERNFDAIILAVSHDDFFELNLQSLLMSHSVVYDVKGVLMEYSARL